MWALFFLIQLAFWYRVFICNCHFLYLSDGHIKTKKIIKPNNFCQPHIWTFWYFEVSVWSGEKSGVFQVCAKIVLRLYTQRAENPDIPQTHPCTSNFHEYHLDILWTPPGTTQDTSQTSQGNKWWQQMTTDANRHKQPAPDTPRHWEVLFEYVWRCLLASVGVSCFMEISWGCLGDVWGVWVMSVGYWRVSGWY